MGRARRREAYNEKRTNLWPHQWSKIPRYWPEDLEKYMRKILIYYPKNLRALKPITGEANTMLAWLVKKRGYGDEEGKITRMETLYMQILAKYKRSYIRHQNIDINYQDPYTYRPNKLETLRLYQSERRKLSIPQVLRRSLRLSKNIKHLEIDGLVACCDDVLENIRNTPSLESLFIGNVKNMSLEALEKSVCGSKATLKIITITGVLKVNPMKLFRILTTLPKLRTVNLEVEFPAKFDVRQIPYKIFKERDIQFNIRLRHYLKGEVKFVTKDRLGMAPVDYLGLNYKQLRPAYRSAWDVRSEERAELQENSKRVLILNFPLEKQWRMLKLFRACKQVKTLDIGLRKGASWNGNEFANLKYLKNLKHVFISLDNTIPGSFWNDPIWKAKAMPGDGLFRNLAVCASTLRFISLHITGEIEIKDDVALLFKLCANTLTHFTLKFTCSHVDETNKMKSLYTYLQELKQLISLKIIYEHFSSTRLGVHAKKMPFTCTTLKEISLTAPAYIDQLNLEFQHLTNLEKIHLCVRTLDDDSILFKNKFVIPDSVRHIEFHTNEFSEKSWHKLLVQFNNLPRLEILMLKMRRLTDNSTNPNLPNKIFKEIKEQMRINDIKILLKDHRSLKCVVYGYGFDLDTVNVFVEDVVCCSDEDVDKFFGRCECVTPRKRMQRVFKVRKEIIEEFVVNKASEEENRGFTGFLKKMFLNLKSHYDINNG